MSWWMKWTSVAALFVVGLDCAAYGIKREQVTLLPDTNFWFLAMIGWWFVAFILALSFKVVPKNE